MGCVVLCCATERGQVVVNVAVGNGATLVVEVVVGRVAGGLAIVSILRL